ncbi:MAG TPA: DUF1566 domain-containing protein [Dissulfurispiraceae bacterium]|nr:DUF1566 domain-containing protein [Dissulfurispiraceae bacterium]
MKRLQNISTAVLIMLLFYSAAHAYKLPDTGQTKCYGTVPPSAEIDCSLAAAEGQDGAYSINPISYTDNGNGTVTDNNTGLMWQRCSMGQDSMTCSGPALTYTWYQAPAATGCGALNTANFAGHNDWRVPSKKELISIVDYSVWGPPINVKYFPNTIVGFYWTSTELASDPNKSNAWYTSFNYGSVYNTSKSGLYPVRCVRGDTTARTFTGNGDTVTDNRTGLVWQKCSPGQNSTTCIGTALRYNWDGALSYCNHLSLANQTDWRIPSAKEFESLTDETIFNPSIDTINFPNTNYGYYWWSSTTDASNQNYNYAWYAAFGGGAVVDGGNKDPLGNLNVRCVRGGQDGSPNLLVRLMNAGTPVNTYSTLLAAYNDAASDGYIIQAQATDLTEALALVDNKTVTLRGGYDSDFLLNLSMTTLYGSLTIQGGTLTVENLMIE